VDTWSRGFRRWFSRPDVTPCGFQVVASRWRWSLSRLWMVQMSRYSLWTASMPRCENLRNPRLALRFPNTGSTVVFRLA